MALSGEAFGNRMCYLEDISNEVEVLFSSSCNSKNTLGILGLLSGFGIVCICTRTSGISSSFTRNGEYNFSRTGKNH
jgi:hypothetical protein